MTRPIDRLTTAPALADALGLDAKYVRHLLRREYPAQAPGKGRQWELTPRMNRRIQAVTGRGPAA